MYYMLWSANFCFMKWMMCGVVSIFVKPYYNRFFGSILLPEKPNIGYPLPPKKSPGYGSVVTSAYTVEEVLGSRPGHVILKMLKIVATAALFSVEHIRVRVGAIIHKLLTL